MTKRLLLLLALFSFQSLFAFSVGRSGDSYVVDGVQWQDVVYDDKDVGFKATLPGATISGLSNGMVYSYSFYQDVHYEVNCKLSSRYSPPPTAELFLQQVVSAYKDRKADIILLKTKKPNVKYAIRIDLEDKKVLLLCSHNQLYWAIVEGSDYSLANVFFDSIQITK